MAINERDQSEFNSAISYLNRINLLFYQAIEARVGLDAYNWFHTLAALYAELSTELKPDEKLKYEDRLDNIGEMINKFMILKRKGRISDFPFNLYKELNRFELDLRQVMKEAGLQMKMKEDAGHALR